MKILITDEMIRKVTDLTGISNAEAREAILAILPDIEDQLHRLRPGVVEESND